MIFLCFIQVSIIVSLATSVVFAQEDQFEKFLEAREKYVITWAIIWITTFAVTEFLPAIAFAWTLHKIGQPLPQERNVINEEEEEMQEE